MPKGRKITPTGVVKESSDVIAEREKARVGHGKFPEQPSKEKKSPEEGQENPPKKASKKR
jgi:hypothetical protein